MDDKLKQGRKFRLLNVIDDFSSEAIGMEFDFSLLSERLIWKIKQITSWRGKPEGIRSNNGPEHNSAVIQAWAQELGMSLEYIQLGNLQQNAYAERFNRTVRYE